jgi:hypothetical protein
LKTAVKALGSRAIDRRTAVGRALSAWRADLAADLGGADQLSIQQQALLDEAVKAKLILDSIDAWVLSQPTLVNKKRRELYPIVRERLALVGQLQSLLRDLGLQRKAREVPDLRSYLAQREDNKEKVGRENSITLVPLVPPTPSHDGASAGQELDPGADAPL